MRSLVGITAAAAALLLVLFAGRAHAVAPPHNESCQQCHVFHDKLGEQPNANLCLTCHNYSGGAKAQSLPFAAGDAATPYGSSPHGSSHSWSGSDTRPEAGAEPPLREKLRYPRLAGTMTCSKCHNLHGPRSSAENSAPFLRDLNDKDQMCLDCHRSRNVTSHLSGSHPLSGSYSGSVARFANHTALFYSTPRSANPANPSGNVKLLDGALLCSSCHRPHYADSDSRSFDNASSALLGRLQPSGGNLLRTDYRGRTPDAVNICTSCHRGKMAHNGGGQNVQCTDCHGGHVEYDPRATGGEKAPNVDLVRRYMNVSSSVARVSGARVFFQYTGSSRNYKDASGTGVCQGCHVVPPAGYSAVKGITYPIEHDLSSAAVCVNCHAHNNSKGSFSGSCSSCHGYPPAPAAAGYATLDENRSPHLIHAGVGGYGYGCDECHKGYSHNTHTYQDVFLMKEATKAGLAASYDGASRSCSQVYCHSNGNGAAGNVAAPVWGDTPGSLGADCSGCHGGNKTSSTPINTNAHRAHTNSDSVLGVSFGCVECHANVVLNDRSIKNRQLHVNGFKDYSGEKAGRHDEGTKLCVNVYCHSNGKIGTSAGKYENPKAWNSGIATGCNSCHGTGNAKGAPDYLSGPAGSDTANSHLRHSVTNTTSGQVTCNNCHSSTTLSGSTIRGDILPMRHINKNPADVTFIPSMASGPYDAATKTCSTVYCHSNGSPMDRPNVYRSVVWGDQSQTACTACHDTGGAGSTLSGQHAPHTSGAYSYGCEKCHSTTVKSSTTLNNAGLHVNRVKDVAFKDGGSYDATGKGCNSYCHSDALGGKGLTPVKWSDSGTPMACFSCHKGRLADNTQANCAATAGTWDQRGWCAPYLNITSNGHAKLVGPQWIRKYACYYCHSGTVDANGNVIDTVRHANGAKDIVVDSRWAIPGRPAPSYDRATKTCDNLYCHSDGTTDPDPVKLLPWNEHGTECNSCHGHPRGSCSASGCHDGRTDNIGKVWVLPPSYGNISSYHWPLGQEWKASTPMFPSEGPGTARANSHMRHLQTNFTCDECHKDTIRQGTDGSSCLGAGCHVSGQPLPTGSMKEVSHLKGEFHVNYKKDVSFKQGGSYDPDRKTCSNTACHTAGLDPQWGGSVSSQVVCLSCHGTTSADSDSFGAFAGPTGTRAKINLTDWVVNGHGRPTSSGPYPISNNPAANFPGNPCWYCHDNNVVHGESGNPFRLRQHPQFSNRFQKECVYCHMTGSDEECLSCHNGGETLAKQLAAIDADATAVWPDGTPAARPDHRGMTDGRTSCITSQCHFVDRANPKNDLKIHNQKAGLWDAGQLADVKNQYMMMGVCLKCHDDDTGGQCTSCHATPSDNKFKYALGFDPGTGFVKPAKAKASSVHFGYKHYAGYKMNGVWKGGKFCWDCHDPHGDSNNVNGSTVRNIYMMQSQVATSTDGWFGLPYTRSQVIFTDKRSGLDYAKTASPYNGICNVCHSQNSKHYRSDGGDGHNASRSCTECHEHRFTSSHADNEACTTCHKNKPVPRHSAFGQPRECTKCHAGTVGNRVDIMGQMGGTSHHIQGVNITSKQCYACHWEATPEGLIDNRYHQGFNTLDNSSVPDAPVELVVWGARTRPTSFKLYSTAVTYLAKNISYGILTTERKEVAKLTPHCLSCHSDQNNDTQPFGDCKTPRQYAWDKQSIAARYDQTGTTKWGKYGTNGKSGVTKALSAHGNATGNQGGYDAANGTDAAIPNTRGGAYNVTCYDCHNSHGSRVVGTTSSYATFNGTKNGGNLKETQAGKGGYSMSYSAQANTDPTSVNPYAAGAGQCFDCHMTTKAGATPWGYQGTYGASLAIRGYMDTMRFGQGGNGNFSRYPYKTMPTAGGHLRASSFLNHTTALENRVDGLCTPCHDPHGVSPTLGAKQQYGVPLLKGTWLTSPYKEDAAPAGSPTGARGLPGGAQPTPNVYTDDATFGYGGKVSEDESSFAGLCVRCHNKEYLTDGKDHTWAGKNRIHESVKGWKTANANQKHNYTCSKCHAPHEAGMKRLMVTNCLNYTHRGRVASGGEAGYGSGSGYYEGSGGPGGGSGSFPLGNGSAGVNCHPGAAWPDNSWNRVTPW
ncbi:CxxxxCH/CxxCH domain-containing protein [Geomonas sp. RF6]|uniref:CxxxxCH/CxxCH domain c-type cytochrome n=1 Tax=Geomonas sp. RF6 TaxID=2897342 RepID=UPI001E40BC08|nr:CxxxxCH/CxxCH domain-containing protein [Geomonas sp. RF6]UFS70324.1 CxxxxCH/CxxCH domain-containing protein [Geomonas sp. RF6]